MLKGAAFGAASATVVAGLSWAATEMRSAMIAQSKLDDHNSSGMSWGFKGDGFKLAGGRYDRVNPRAASWLGGQQGGPGYFFGIKYSPGSFLDKLCETFAGPHDFLNSGYWYDASGNIIQNMNGLQRAVGEASNGLNVMLAAPFAAASVTPLPAAGVIGADAISDRR